MAKHTIIELDGQRWRVLPSKRVVVVNITTDGTTGNGDQSFEAPDDLLVETITGWSSDSKGLAGFRLGWVDDGGRNVDFYGASKDVDPAYPVASTVITDASVTKLDRWNIVFCKSKTRKFIVQNAGSTAGFTVSLTLACKHLVKA